MISGGSARYYFLSVFAPALCLTGTQVRTPEIKFANLDGIIERKINPHINQSKLRKKKKFNEAEDN